MESVKSRWQTKDEDKERLLTIARDAMETTDIGIALQGARLLLAAEDQNQKDEVRTTQRDTIIQNVINMAEPSAPDPEYLVWKRQKMMDQQDETTELIEQAEKYPLVSQTKPDT